MGMRSIARRLWYVINHRRAERELREELDAHLAMRRQELEDTGLDVAEADAAARRAMGGQLLARDRSRDVWLRPWLSGFVLDFRLAVRMLARYPALTIVGSVGIAFGLAAGVAGFEIRTQMIDPRLPLDDGHRIVGIRNWDIRNGRPGPSTAADFISWRDQLQTVEDLGAVVLAEHNLTVNGAVEPIGVAEMTASGFRVARVPALLGRTLVENDALPGAPPVAVIGHSLWQRRFLADPGIVGRPVQLGIEHATIVGVMPAEFGFPVAHQVWIPFRAGQASGLPQTLDHAPHGGGKPSGSPDGETLLVFGRLARAATINQARAEMTTIGLRMATDAPEARRSFQPQVVAYANLFLDPQDYQRGLALANVFLVLLVVLVSANVALLMFARAAARESEIAVRNALGATRSRIVAQLFVESVVLSALSAGIGVTAARFVLRSFWRMTEADGGGQLPFWLNDSLTPATIAYAVGLTMIGAVIIGVLPALEVTGRGMQSRLRQFTSGGGGYRFGGVWTAVIVSQVAATVMFPAAAFFFHRWVVEGQTRDVGFPASEYLSARLVLDPTNARGATIEELRTRLASEPGLTVVTFADHLPGTLHPGSRYEVEGDQAPPTYGHEARVASVDTNFFAAFGAPVLSGRGFTPIDLASGSQVAIVNASFANRVLGGRDAVGRRIRRATLDSERTPGPWIEIVGIVPDLGVLGSNGIGLYRPLARDSATMHVAIRARTSPESFADRLRVLANDVDPTLRVYDVMPLDKVGADLWLESQYLSRLLAVLSGIALLLSLTAIYSVMAFTVVQRTREIGVRVAIGADRRSIIAAIVSRPLGQIGRGIGAGAALVVFVFVGLFESAPTPVEAGMIAAYAALMLGVCLLGCVVPTRRALRLEPSQVLRGE